MRWVCGCGFMPTASPTTAAAASSLLDIAWGRGQKEVKSIAKSRELKRTRKQARKARDASRKAARATTEVTRKQGAAAVERTKSRAVATRRRIAS